jgi:hypothetical protein
VLWRRPSIFVFVLSGNLLAGLSSYGLREAIGRERPTHRFPDPRPLVDVPVSGSFPSGHAAMSFACAALLAWLTPLPKVPLFALAADNLASIRAIEKAGFQREGLLRSHCKTHGERHDCVMFSIVPGDVDLQG